MLTLYHAWSSMPAQAVRLALAYKKAGHRTLPIGPDSDALFFDLGVAVSPLVLVLEDGSIHTNPESILRSIDAFAAGEPLIEGVLAEEDWSALLAWRAETAALLARLQAPALLAFADIAATPEALAAYKAQVERRFGMGVEALANDRYDGYRQLARLACLPQLAWRLAKERFYSGGRLSAADLLLACELFPLQLLDGITLPLDLLYYIDRVEKACGASPREGLVMRL